MFCTKCGSYVPDGQHFCTSCGAPMEEFGPADAAPAQPTYQQPGQTQQGYGQPASVTGASDLPPYMPPVDVPGVCDVGAGGPGPQGPKKNGKKAALITVGVLVAILAGGGAGYYFGVYRPQQAEIERIEKKKEEEAVKHSKHPVRITATGMQWDTDTGATKLPVHVTGTDVDGKDVDTVFYVDSDGNGIKLMQGNYSLQVAASPLGADGEIWDVPNISVSIKLGDALKKGEKLDLRENAKFELGDPINAVDVEAGEITMAQNYARQGGCDDKDEADRLAGLASSARNGAVASYNAAVSEASRKSRTYDGDVFTFEVPEDWGSDWDVKTSQGTYSGVKNGLWVDYKIVHDGYTVGTLMISNHFSSGFNTIGKTNNVGKSTNLWLGSYDSLSGDSGWEYIIDSIYIK